MASVATPPRPGKDAKPKGGRQAMGQAGWQRRTSSWTASRAIHARLHHGSQQKPAHLAHGQPRRGGVGSGHLRLRRRPRLWPTRTQHNQPAQPAAGQQHQGGHIAATAGAAHGPACRVAQRRRCCGGLAPVSRPQLPNFATVQLQQILHEAVPRLLRGARHAGKRALHHGRMKRRRRVGGLHCRGHLAPQVLLHRHLLQQRPTRRQPGLRRGEGGRRAAGVSATLGTARACRWVAHCSAQVQQAHRASSRFWCPCRCSAQSARLQHDGALQQHSASQCTPPRGGAQTAAPRPLHQG